MKTKAANPQQGACGTVVTWRTSGFVARSAMVEAMKDVGLEQVPVRESEPRTWVRRAVRQAAKDGLLRIVADDNDYVSFAVVEEHVEPEKRHWRGIQDFSVTLDKKSGEVTFSKPTALSEAIRSAVKNNQGGLMGMEVGATIKQAIEREALAIPLRDGGGTYFVPSSRKDVLDKLDMVMSRLRAASPSGYWKINRFDVMANTRSTRDVGNLLEELYIEQAEKLEEQCINKMENENSRRKSFEQRAKEIAVYITQSKEYEAVLKADFVKMRNRLRQGRLRIAQMWREKNSFDGKKKGV